MPYRRNHSCDLSCAQPHLHKLKILPVGLHIFFLELGLHHAQLTLLNGLV
jgi:hypothetical protein